MEELLSAAATVTGIVTAVLKAIHTFLHPVLHPPVGKWVQCPSFVLANLGKFATVVILVILVIQVVLVSLSKHTWVKISCVCSTWHK